MKQPIGLRPTRSSLAALALTTAGIFAFSAGTSHAAVTPVFTTETLNALLASAGSGATEVSQGDVLYKVAFLQSLRAGGTGNAAATPADVPVWPNGIVYYSFASSVTSEQKELFLDAAAEWTAVADITFIARTSDKTDYIEVRSGDLNQSHIGYQGGKQTLSILNWDHRFIIVHQLGHALGLHHEDSRSDRDDFVTINQSNVQPGKSVGLAKTATDNLTDYDYDSLMHQGRAIYSKNGQDTIVPKEPNEAKIHAIGQLSYLSPGDVLGIQELYGTRPTGVSGTLSTLNLTLSPKIQSVVVQKDGKVIVGGQFTAAGTAGTGKANLFRVGSDGTTDAAFSPKLNSSVDSVVLLPDQRIAISGAFTTIGTVTKPFAAILKADGTLDTTFTAANTPAADSSAPKPTFRAAQPDGKLVVAYPGSASVSLRRITTTFTAPATSSGTVDEAFTEAIFTRSDALAPSVDTVLIQPDGKLLVAGAFHSANGTPCNGIVRLLSTGALDPAFTTLPELFGASSLALQPDGKILAGVATGTTTVNPGITRLHPDGSIDDSFQAIVTATQGVKTINLQSDGKIIIGGDITAVGGTPTSHIARLDASGALDNTFSTDVTKEVNTSVLDQDGTLLAGGASNLQAAISNDPATSSLYATRIRGVEDSGVVRWSPGGSFPQPREVSLDLSVDGGANWITLGDATHDADGWFIAGLDLPGNGILRANGELLGSSANRGGEAGPMTSITNAYVLDGAASLTINNGKTNLTNGDTIALGNVPLGASVPVSYTLGNSGIETLTDVALTIDGPAASDFTIVASPATTLAAGATSPISINFSPTSIGAKTAYLRVASSDPLNSPFTIILTSQGTPVPDIAVFQPVKTELVDDKTKKSFGTSVIGRGLTKTFTITNTGGATLKNIAVRTDGKHAKDFIVTAPKKTIVKPGEKVAFKVTFKPHAKGVRNAALHITSNDPDESSFDIKLTGQGSKGGRSR